MPRASLRAGLPPTGGQTCQRRLREPGRRDKLQLGSAIDTRTRGQPSAERRGASSHRPQAHPGPVCIRDPASVIADGHEERSPRLHDDHVDVTRRAVRSRVDDSFTRNANDVLTLHRIEVAPHPAFRSDLDLQTVAVPELAGDDAKRGVGGRSRRSREVRDSRRARWRARCERRSSEDAQVPARCRVAAPVGDARQILRQPVVQVAGDPFTLRVIAASVRARRRSTYSQYALASSKA